MSLLVYIPGVQGADPEHLARAGLGGLVGPNAPSLIPLEVLRGPDGGRGMLYTWRSDPAPYRPDEQDWTAGPAAPAAESEEPRAKSKKRGKAPALGSLPSALSSYWLGRWKDRPIAPAALARPKQYRGPLVELRDGQAWQIPVAFQLPQIAGEWTVPGQLEFRPVEEFRDYWEQAGRWLGLFLRKAQDVEGTYTYAFQDAWTFACRALAINYLLTPAIVTWLELIDTTCFEPIAQAAIEMEEMRQKKTVV